VTAKTIAAAIVRVALLPTSEWTDDDLYLMLRKEERETGVKPEPWLVRGRALAMLAKVIERLFEREDGSVFVFPTDEESLEFSVDDPKRT
jgi:hypothetical protein